MKHIATLKEHELTWNMMNQVWELTAIIETDGRDMQLYVPLSNCPQRQYIKMIEEIKKLKELLKECRELFDELNYLNMVEKIDNAIGEKK